LPSADGNGGVSAWSSAPCPLITELNQTFMRRKKKLRKRRVLRERWTGQCPWCGRPGRYEYDAGGGHFYEERSCLGCHQPLAVFARQRTVKKIIIEEPTPPTMMLTTGQRVPLRDQQGNQWEQVAGWSGRFHEAVRDWR
jgi:hypothetical protein